MAKIKGIGKALVITSTLKEAEIKKLAMYKPEALELKNEDKETYFRVACGHSPSFSKNGAVFNAQNSDGFAQMTLINEEQSNKSAGDRQKEIVSEYGFGIKNLNAVEEQAKNALSGIDTELAAVESSVTVE